MRQLFALKHIFLCKLSDFASVADMQAIEPLNQSDTGFRDFADPNYLRRIIAMFPNV